MRQGLRGLAGVLLSAAALQAAGAEVSSVAPAAVSVTVYRAADRAGWLSLEDLRGFALITETRQVSLPAGDSTLRFEGVAGGIQAESALVTGFPDGVIEKNRDARLLSPSTLLAASLHRPVDLERTDPKTGETRRTRGMLESDAGGILFRSAAGLEALHCSGLPETFGFERFAGEQARPTLTVRVRSEAPITRTVTLSYLASGFDWSATYTARLARDRKTLDLGAWVTLANGNGEAFRDAQTQLIAGRPNRESNEPQAGDAGGPILAQCWPRGSTSGGAPVPSELPPAPMMMRSLAAPMADGVMQEVTLTAARKVVQEQLGDLKLYRVPERSTLAPRQMKQVRLLDQYAVPVTELYALRIEDEDGEEGEPIDVRRQLRTRNTRSNHLGLPLPAGSLALYAAAPQGAALLIGEHAFADHAVDEDVTIELGASPDLEAIVRTEERAVTYAGAVVPLLPGIELRSLARQVSRQLEVTSALAHETTLEVQLQLGPTERLVRADRPLQLKNGRPTFTLKVPAQSRLLMRYATAASDDLLHRRR